MKCDDCGRELNITDWHYGRCAECKEALTLAKWLNLLEELDEINN